MQRRPTANECRDWFRGLSDDDKAKAARFCEYTADAAVSKIGLKLLAKQPYWDWLAVWDLIETHCLFWNDEPEERFRELKALKFRMEEKLAVDNGKKVA